MIPQRGSDWRPRSRNRRFAPGRGDPVVQWLRLALAPSCSGEQPGRIWGGQHTA
jgi:hypothetical protein